ncbi:hypothetical protein GCM10009127_09820 [Alteraurantiacibacter aestuarii]|uniref:Uncharacterized protein n=1 Tax=Alteraurantiacibacter aestuarii TaxID=650004 RepID=A0A844ZK11_9SPHN|nr:hypothetical protein [Alteraurantiacibacter aestuarii]MXO87370.1 hypothetical protein [Alteraurantiacibacter aestuarii]
MRTKVFAAALAFAFIGAPAMAQDAAQMEARFEAPPAGWEVPRTDWGDPDLRGKWPVDYLGQTPRERPAHFGTRAFLTDEEYREAFADAQAQLDRYDEEVQVGVMSMGHWAERGHPLRQNSMVVEPENGRYPQLTALGQQLRANEHTSWNTEVFDSMDDFGIFDRCLTRGLPSSMLPGAYNGGIEIFQSPGLVAISLEMIHETRMVYLDGRSPPPANMQYDLGYSIGHWEGDTLVIETTNFRPGMSAGPAPNSEQLHVTEHLTIRNPDQIHYEAWVSDPLVMEGSYKLDLPWLRDSDYGMFEYACHEGNVQVRGYITSTSPRFAAEREAAWASRESGGDE